MQKFKAMFQTIFILQRFKEKLLFGNLLTIMRYSTIYNFPFKFPIKIYPNIGGGNSTETT